MKNRTLTLAMTVATAAGLQSLSFAQTITIAGPVNFGGPIGDVNNTVLTGQSPVTTAFLMKDAATVNSGDITEVLTATYATEATLRLENDAFPGIYYATDFTDVGAMTGTFSAVPGTVRPYTLDGGNAALIPVASSWNVECYETFDDGAGVDSTGSNLSVTVGTNLYAINSGVLPGPFDSAGPVNSPENSILNVATISAPTIFPASITFSGVGTEVIPATSISQVRFRIRSSAFPGISADFQPSTSTSTLVTVSNAVLAAPNATLTDSGGNALKGMLLPIASVLSGQFFELFDDGAGADTQWTNVHVRASNGSAIAPATPPTATDLGVVTDATLTTTLTALTGPWANTVSWFKFNLPADVNAGNGRFLDIWTTRPSTTHSGDTVLCLYDSTGRFIAWNDDGAGAGPTTGTTSFMSAIAYGSNSDTVEDWTLNAADLAFDGRTGEGLPAGDYYVALCPYASVTRADGFVLTGPTTASDGTQINIRSNVPGGSNQTLSGTLALGDTVGAFSYNRNIAYEVKQGVTTIASGTLTVSANSSALSISVP
ncbi:MAG: hypothetical protein JNK63_01735, partial [Chthonomonas sp.]|nr:hypothetical protein [Chthonomonas sp.]